MEIFSQKRTISLRISSAESPFPPNFGTASLLFAKSEIPGDAGRLSQAPLRRWLIFSVYHRSSAFKSRTVCSGNLVVKGFAEQMLTEQFIGLRACNISFESRYRCVLTLVNVQEATIIRSEARGEKYKGKFV